MADTTAAPTNKVWTYIKNGVEYYVAIMHPGTAAILREYEVQDSAMSAARAAGKNWRRVKREGRKAVMAWKRANGRNSRVSH